VVKVGAGLPDEVAALHQPFRAGRQRLLLLGELCLSLGGGFPTDSKRGAIPMKTSFNCGLKIVRLVNGEYVVLA
jgi:hypothetical protein